MIKQCLSSIKWTLVPPESERGNVNIIRLHSISHQISVSYCLSFEVKNRVRTEVIFVETQIIYWLSVSSFHFNMEPSGSKNFDLSLQDGLPSLFFFWHFKKKLRIESTFNNLPSDQTRLRKICLTNFFHATTGLARKARFWE